MSLGSKIVELREKKKMTRYRLSKNSGVGYSYLSAVEKDIAPSPSFAVVVKVARALKVSVTVFEKEVV